MADKPAPYTTNKNKQQDTKQDIGPTEEIPIYNIFNKGNQTIHFTLKQRRYIDLDMSKLANESQGFAIPYQTVGFWISNATATNNQNWRNYLQIAGICWGMRWKKGRYTINLQAVTRQRMLQTGGTNTLTWDFETSQNLVHATVDRCPSYYQVSTQGTATAKLPQFAIGGIIAEEPVLWNNEMDATTYEQIAQRQRLTKTIHFEPPPHGFVYPLVVVNDLSLQALIPGRDRISQIGSGTFTMANNSNVITNSYTAGADTHQVIVTNETFDNTKACPMHLLCQPKVPDETGFMNFRYQLHYETELEIEMYVRPDTRPAFASATNIEQALYEAHEKRFVIPYATLPTNVQNARVPCFPYNLTNN